VNNVVCSSWTEEGGQDDLISDCSQVYWDTQEADTYTFRVNIADHNQQWGFYHTKIYATDCAGNRSEVELGTVVGSDIQLEEDAPYSLEENHVIVVKDKTKVEELLACFKNPDLKPVDCNGNTLEDGAFAGTGTRFNLCYGDHVLDTVTVVVPGDLDGNGIVDTTDYMRVKAVLRGTLAVDQVQNMAADVDANGKLGVTDYMRIKSYFQGTYHLHE
jgi:hypothetical protein